MELENGDRLKIPSVEIQIQIDIWNFSWLLNPHILQRYEFGHRNSFPKFDNFPSYFTQLCYFPGGATFEKHADPEKRIETVGNHVRTVGTW